MGTEGGAQVPCTSVHKLDHLTKGMVSGKWFQVRKHNNLQSAELWCTTCHSHILTDNLTWTNQYFMGCTPIMAHHHTFQQLPLLSYTFRRSLYHSRWKPSLHRQTKIEMNSTPGAASQTIALLKERTTQLCTCAMRAGDTDCPTRIYCSCELFPIPVT